MCVHASHKYVWVVDCRQMYECKCVWWQWHYGSEIVHVSGEGGGTWGGDFLPESSWHVSMSKLSHITKHMPWLDCNMLEGLISRGAITALGSFCGIQLLPLNNYLCFPVWVGDAPCENLADQLEYKWGRMFLSFTTGFKWLVLVLTYVDEHVSRCVRSLPRSSV